MTVDCFLSRLPALLCAPVSLIWFVLIWSILSQVIQENLPFNFLKKDRSIGQCTKQWGAVMGQCLTTGRGDPHGWPERETTEQKAPQNGDLCVVPKSPQSEPSWCSRTNRTAVSQRSGSRTDPLPTWRQLGYILKEECSFKNCASLRFVR